MQVRSNLERLTVLASVPWNAFVAAFVYYAALAVVSLSGSNPGTAMVATAYAAPPAMYGVTLAARVLRAAFVAFVVTAVKRPGVLPLDPAGASVL